MKLTWHDIVKAHRIVRDPEQLYTFEEDIFKREAEALNKIMEHKIDKANDARRRARTAEKRTAAIATTTKRIQDKRRKPEKHKKRVDEWA